MLSADNLMVLIRTERQQRRRQFVWVEIAKSQSEAETTPGLGRFEHKGASIVEAVRFRIVLPRSSCVSLIAVEVEFTTAQLARFIIASSIAIGSEARPVRRPGFWM